MEEAWHWSVIDGNFIPIGYNIFGEGRDFWSEILFVDHVEPSDQFGKSFIFCASSLFDMSKHFGDVGLTNDFQTCEHKFELEVWGLLLELVDDFSNHS